MNNTGDEWNGLKMENGCLVAEEVERLRNSMRLLKSAIHTHDDYLQNAIEKIQHASSNARCEMYDCYSCETCILGSDVNTLIDSLKEEASKLQKEAFSMLSLINKSMKNVLWEVSQNATHI